MSTSSPETKKPRLEPSDEANSHESAQSSDGSRKQSSPALPASFFQTGRPTCPYGISCYRKNPHHFKENQHTQLEELFTLIIHANDSPEHHSKYKQADQFSNKETLVEQLKILRGFGFGKGAANSNGTEPTWPSSSSQSSDGDLEVVCEQNTPGAHAQGSSQGTQDMLTKWANSCPFNFFLTTLSAKENTHYSVGFQDLFDPSLGPVKAVIHFNFMIEFEWLIDHTLAVGLEGKPLTLLFGNWTPELGNASTTFPWISTQLIKSPFPFGHHHTKLTLIKYDDDSLRFVVSTANLIESDWEKRTQGVWISPKCPVSPTPNVGCESPTNFRRDIIQYLTTYPIKHVAAWIAAIRNCDCSEIKVAFIGSAPVTTASSTNGFEWGHKKVEKLLKEAGKESNAQVDSNWSLIMQCSSIGTLGPNDDWLRHEIGTSFTPLANAFPLSANKTPIHVIFPSHQNVLSSIDGVHGGGCLPYSYNTHAKQMWFRSYLQQWKSDLFGRTRAVPHIKAYCRISPDCNRLAWFLLTSANLSKAAWGKLNKGRTKLGVMSWEAGVLYLPKYFGCDTFQVAKSAELGPGGTDVPIFRLPFDVPVTKYADGDRPWIIEALQALEGSSSYE